MILEQLYYYIKLNGKHSFLRTNKKGSIEIDQTGMLILGVILFLVLLGIIFYLRGSFSDQESSIDSSISDVLGK